ncbi:MBL fold metallo-hydrolase [Porphyrobacter algicida]|uniref:MBL fold metallo-hydrolase n=1 Tax=Qipengyuania algicida TaxID=1836209 RepID=A0A845AFT2_9SPHN|nr:MBL fold metallo-hydrolase [Qipengyuania algicida]MXP28494.1 MBL fold metallo-hydrolase [Qipengyuania algicida]
MKMLMLGSGTSTGVPRVGNDWGACDPEEPRNRRTRVSVLISNDAGQRILIDTSTDLRQQLLAHRVDHLDAVLWTHDHADHCHGIDDLRVLRYGRSNPLPGFANTYTVSQLKRRFDYIFDGQHGYPSIVDIKPLGQTPLIAGFAVEAVDMPHGPARSTGYRLEADGATIVYATDFSEITSEMIACFDGADILICDCLRRKPHPTHAHLDMALELAERTQAARLVLTHLDKSMDYRSLCQEVPEHVTVGFDGLEITA